MPQGNPAEQLARELVREAAFLPDKWRLWLFEQLQEDAAAFDKEQQRVDQLNQKMSEAVKALERVAQHLKLKEQRAQLALTMREFDSTPEKVRQGWKARRVADAVRGSWQLAKAVAFKDVMLPVIQERQWQHRKGIARKRREGAFIFTGLKEWLDGNPTRKLRKDYQAWVEQQNKKRGAEQKRLVSGQAIQDRLKLPWAEIVKAIEAGLLPGEVIEPDEQLEADAIEASPEPLAPLPAFRLNKEQLRSAREAKSWTVTQLARYAKLTSSHLSKIENGVISNPSITSVAALAHALGLPLNSLISEN